MLPGIPDYQGLIFLVLILGSWRGFADEIRIAHAVVETQSQGLHNRQGQKGDQTRRHPRLWQERHGLVEEPAESRLQQDLPQDQLLDLGSVSVGMNETAENEDGWINMNAEVMMNEISGDPNLRTP